MHDSETDLASDLTSLHARSKHYKHGIYENSDANEEGEQYTIKAVTSTEEAIKFGELGYELLDEIHGVRLYRKRCIDV